MVAFDGGQASLTFDGAARFGAEDRTYIAGSAGTLDQPRPGPRRAAVTLTTAAGIARPAARGHLVQRRLRRHDGRAPAARSRTGDEPLNDARGNLDALALVFAAIASARRGVPVAPGAIRSLAAAEG